MQAQAEKLKETLEKTINLQDIDKKLEQKLIKFINKEHKKKFPERDNLKNVIN